MQLIAALLLLLCSLTAALAQPQGPIWCNLQTTSPVNFTTKVTVIPAPPGNQRILVCGWVISAPGNATVTFQYGTGGNCSTTTSPTPWGPVVLLTPTIDTVVDASFVWRGMITPAGADLCMTASTAATATIYYTTQ